MSTVHEAIVRRVFTEVFSQGDLATIDELYAPAFELHVTTHPDRIHGREGLKAFVIMVRTAFPDLEVTVDDLFAVGEKVVARWTARGTQQGAWLGVAPTGKPVTTSGITISHIVDGQIVETWQNADLLGQLRQLGVLPVPDAFIG